MTTEHYLMDLGALLRGLAVEAQQGDVGLSSEAAAFASGRRMALYEVLSLMVSQARVFDLSDEAIGLADFPIESLLYPGSD